MFADQNCSKRTKNTHFPIEYSKSFDLIFEYIILDTHLNTGNAINFDLNN